MSKQHIYNTSSIVSFWSTYACLASPKQYFRHSCQWLVGWFMVLSAIFNNISAISRIYIYNPWLYRGGHFYWWEKPEKTSCVLLYFFFWPLCCLFFDIRILIAPLVSSNSFCVTFTDIRIFFIHVITCTSTSTSTYTLVIRKESSDSSHECIILDVIHHVLIKNICTCAV
jgi:hypothetical protein